MWSNVSACPFSLRPRKYQDMGRPEIPVILRPEIGP